MEKCLKPYFTHLNNYINFMQIHANYGKGIKIEWEFYNYISGLDGAKIIQAWPDCVESIPGSIPKLAMAPVHMASGGVLNKRSCVVLILSQAFC